MDDFNNSSRSNGSSKRRNTRAGVPTSLTIFLMILSSSGRLPSPLYSPSSCADHIIENNINNSKEVVSTTMLLLVDAYIVDTTSSSSSNMKPKPTSKREERKENMVFRRVVQEQQPSPSSHPTTQIDLNQHQHHHQRPSSLTASTSTRRLSDLDRSVTTTTTSPTSYEIPTPHHFGDHDVKPTVGMPDASTTTIEDNDVTLEEQQQKIVVLSPIEAWCLSRMDRWYSTSQSMKCPFMRRRSGDVLDGVEKFMNRFIVRPECQQTPQAHRPPGTNKKQNKIKHKHLTPEQIRRIILEDWTITTVTGNGDDNDDCTTTSASSSSTNNNNSKGYYITGKLTTGVYRDDCLFLGPDPDMPIHGTRKYVGVASHLFDYKESDAVLHSLKIVSVEELESVRLRPTAKVSAALRDVHLRDRRLCPYDRPNSTHKNMHDGSTTTSAAAAVSAYTAIPTSTGNKICLVADWTLSGILRLPWRPSLPTFSGQTIYHLDDEGLVLCHEESWDCSAIQAFCHTLLPGLSEKIWRQQQP